MGKWCFEDEVPAVLDLGDRVKARKIHLAAFLFGKLAPENQSPVIELVADNGGTQTVGGGL
jgi:hypothetical protein